MSRQYIYIYLIVVILLNVVWAFVPAEYGSPIQENAKQRWDLSKESPISSLDWRDLMEGGFWGQVDESQDEHSEGKVEIAAAEAKKIRTLVRAIINNGRSKEVIFVESEEYQRIKLGDSIPGTQWVLIDVGEDWLKLSSVTDKSKTEVLKLFAGKNQHL